MADNANDSLSFGSFHLGSFQSIFDAKFEEADMAVANVDPDFLDDFSLEDMESLAEIVASTLSENAAREMATAFESNETKLELDQPTKKRFKKLSDVELRQIDESRQSASTKRNTKWGVKLFQDWATESNGVEVDFLTICPESLNENLRLFYAEAQPKNQHQRELKMAPNQAKEYHKNTLKNVRSVLNRHLHDIGRDIDIFKDKVFKLANDLLDGKLKFNVQHGLSRPTQHKPIIEPDELIKISTYLHSANTPVLLRYRVWYSLAIHFITRGLEFHQQLTPSSFQFNKNENNVEYVTLTHETKQKNRQGGLNSEEAPSDKRMYATENDQCPVKALRQLIEKTDPNAESLFNHCNKDAITSPDTESVWYSCTHVKAYQFSRFMSDISRNAKCSKSYTAHCLRATCIQAMSDAGFELRHIMFMSGHRNETSVRSNTAVTHQLLRKLGSATHCRLL